MGAIDRELLEAVTSLRWHVLSPVFVLLSAWWVKSVLIAGIGGVADAVSRRLPLTALFAGAAAAAGSFAASLLKLVVDRPRPGGDALVAVPASSSFPSGHAATAFAAAAAVGFVYPRLRLPMFVLAALVALSRVYLGVHYPADVLAGALLGLGVVWALSRVSARVARALARSAA